MMIARLPFKIFIIAVMTVLFSCVAGCGGGGGDDDSENVENNDSENVDNVDDTDDTENSDVTLNNFIGTWLITKEGTTSYWIFNEDGTFIKKRADEPLDGATHFTGTYSVSGGFLTGEFTNPGVGNGEIEGTINDDDIFLMDFIEYWHTPKKVVPCVGVRQ